MRRAAPGSDPAPLSPTARGRFHVRQEILLAVRRALAHRNSPTRAQARRFLDDQLLGATRPAAFPQDAAERLPRPDQAASATAAGAGPAPRTGGSPPQKPLRRAYEQDPQAVRRWLEEQYPALRRQVVQENAEIHWLDEMGVRA